VVQGAVQGIGWIVGVSLALIGYFGKSQRVKATFIH
jgi:hypothetical protein